MEHGVLKICASMIVLVSISMCKLLVFACEQVGSDNRHVYSILASATGGQAFDCLWSEASEFALLVSVFFPTHPPCCVLSVRVNLGSWADGA